MSDGNRRTFDVATGSDESNGGGIVVSNQQGSNKASSALTYSIEVCQGPDCTGLGGGVAILEIEELVKEHHYHATTTTSSNCDRIRVVAGGCRDFCSVGPNVHVLVRDKSHKTRRKQQSMLESFANVKDAPSCEKAVHYAVACATQTSNGSSYSGCIDENKASSSSARSMMTRRAERTRWGALKDVSRTIAKGKRVVAAAAATGDNDDAVLARKQRIWTETCHDRIQQAVATSGGRPSQRDQRRTERLLQMATEKLERICLQHDSDSDSSCSSSSSSSDVESDEVSSLSNVSSLEDLESKLENLEIEMKRRKNIEKEKIIEMDDKIMKDLEANVKMRLKTENEKMVRNLTERIVQKILEKERKEKCIPQSQETLKREMEREMMVRNMAQRMVEEELEKERNELCIPQSQDVPVNE